MTYNLFLDDERNPSDVNWVMLPYKVNWEIVRTYNEFKNMILKKGVPAFVTFDHDLSDYQQKIPSEEDSYEYDDGDLKKTYTSIEMTGYDCAKWLAEYCYNFSKQFPEFQVHSMNPVGQKRIRDYLEWFMGVSK